MSTDWQVTLHFKWPEGLESGKADGFGYEAGEDCEWDFNYHDGPPFLPAVGERIIFDDYSQPDSVRDGFTHSSTRRFLEGEVVSREYEMSQTDYQGRWNYDSGVTLELANVGEWKP